jgi:branched-chain amino acid transport system permease protein
MDWQTLSQFVLSGVSTGCIYALVALGFVLCANATGVINFAAGEYVMIGGLVTASLAGLGVPLPFAALAAVVAGAALGLLQERATLAPIRRAPSFIRITVTLGFAIVVRGAALILWGKDPFPLRGFSGDGVFEFMGAVLVWQVIWVWALTGATLLLLYVLLMRTPWGRAIRACADNERAARLMGIEPVRVGMIVFAASGAIGALGGAAIAPITLASWSIGIEFGLKGFIGALIGSFRSTPLAVAGGISIGVAETLVAGYVSSGSREIVVYALLVIVLIATSGLLRRGRKTLTTVGHQ